MKYHTERLFINELTYQDSDFIIALLNQPSFIKFIGDKHVYDKPSAIKFLDDGPLKTYPKGIGMYCVRLKSDGQAIGLCGLMQRSFLPVPDLGFAFLETTHGKGYAQEAASVFLKIAKDGEKYQTLTAITNLENDASIGLLKKLGFREEIADETISELKETRYFELTL